MISNRVPKIEKQLTLEELLPLRSLGSSCRTIITPTDRLARFLRNYEHERNKGITRPGHNIIDYKTWIKTIWDEQLQLQDPRMLLSKNQEQALWTSIIEENKSKRSLINIFDTAKSLSQARKLLCQFRCFHCSDCDLKNLRSQNLISHEDIDFLRRAKCGELPDSDYEDPDRDFFLEMHSQYRKKCQENGWIDSAELPDIIIDAIHNGKTAGLTQEVIFAGFSNTEPQTVALKDALKDALKAKGHDAYFAEIASKDKVGDFRLITDKSSAATSPVSPYLSPEDEYKACAEWAIAKLNEPSADNDGKKKIYAILAPNLEEISGDLQAVLDNYLCPEIILPENRLMERPYNISYSKPLISYYAVSQALLGIELAFKGLPAEEMGHFLLSPCFVPSPVTDNAEDCENISEQAQKAKWKERNAAVQEHLSQRAAIYAKIRSKRQPHAYIDDIKKSAKSLESSSKDTNCPEKNRLKLKYNHALDFAKELDDLSKYLKDAVNSAEHPEDCPARNIDDIELKISQWPEIFFAILKNLHFMEGLQSFGTHQLINKLMEAINSLKSLQAVFPDKKYSAAQAMRFLRSALSQKQFQPRTANAKRLQIMGFMEAQGQKFEEARIINFQDRAWPASSAPLSFLPYRLQKCFDMPNSSPEANLEFSKHITESLKLIAPQGLASWARTNGSSDKLEEYRLSPQWQALTDGKTLPAGASESQEGTDLLTWPESVNKANKDKNIQSARTDDEIALQPQELNDGFAKGGTKIIETWAQCPFRAFAELRLGAKGLEDIEQYPGALEKGILIHNIMQFFWTGKIGEDHHDTNKRGALDDIIENAVAEAAAQHPELKEDLACWKNNSGCRTQEKLIALRGNGKLEDSKLAKIVALCTGIFIKDLADQNPQISQTFLDFEKERAARLICAFLDFETKRRSFQVCGAEMEQDVSIPLPEGNPLKFKAKIDRIDEYLDDGGKCVIDYKTGNNANINEWADVRKDKLPGEPDRLKSPQVPIYANYLHQQGEKVDSAAFARIAAGLTENEMLQGIGRDNDPDPATGATGIKAANNKEFDGRTTINKFYNVTAITNKLPKMSESIEKPTKKSFGIDKKLKENASEEETKKYKESEELYNIKLKEYEEAKEQLEKNRKLAISKEYPYLPGDEQEDWQWKRLLYLWGTSISRIAEQFCAGAADASPLKNICTYCNLSSMCRKLTDRELAEEENNYESAE
ncbi:MAG: PD-(D/E)XK nuclease family protein [bacterium]|nr:PD-(D/E)XK nuclease family protein [bacterium]